MMMSFSFLPFPFLSFFFFFQLFFFFVCVYYYVNKQFFEHRHQSE